MFVRNARCFRTPIARTSHIAHDRLLSRFYNCPTRHAILRDPAIALLLRPRAIGFAPD